MDSGREEEFLITALDIGKNVRLRNVLTLPTHGYLTTVMKNGKLSDSVSSFEMTDCVGGTCMVDDTCTANVHGI